MSVDDWVGVDGGGVGGAAAHGGESGGGGAAAAHRDEVGFHKCVSLVVGLS